MSLGNDLTPVNREEGLLAGENIEPVTRLEHFLARAGKGGAVNISTDGDNLGASYKQLKEMRDNGYDPYIIVDFSSAGVDMEIKATLVMLGYGNSSYSAGFGAPGGDTLIQYYADTQTANMVKD